MAFLSITFYISWLLRLAVSTPRRSGSARNFSSFLIFNNFSLHNAFFYFDYILMNPLSLLNILLRGMVILATIFACLHSPTIFLRHTLSILNLTERLCFFFFFHHHYSSLYISASYKHTFRSPLCQFSVCTTFCNILLCVIVVLARCEPAVRFSSIGLRSMESRGQPEEKIKINYVIFNCVE